MGWVRQAGVHNCLRPSQPSRGDLWRCDECRTLWRGTKFRWVKANWWYRWRYPDPEPRPAATIRSADGRRAPSGDAWTMENRRKAADSLAESINKPLRPPSDWVPWTYVTGPEKPDSTKDTENL